MSQSRESIWLSIGRKLAEPATMDKLLAMGGSVVVALIWATMLYLLLSPLAGSGARLMETNKDGIEYLQKRLDDGTLIVKEVVAGP